MSLCSQALAGPNSTAGSFSNCTEFWSLPAWHSSMTHPGWYVATRVIPWLWIEVLPGCSSRTLVVWLGKCIIDHFVFDHESKIWNEHMVPLVIVGSWTWFSPKNSKFIGNLTSPCGLVWKQSTPRPAMVAHNFPRMKWLFHWRIWRDTPFPDTSILFTFWKCRSAKALKTKSRVAKSTQSAGSCSYRQRWLCGSSGKWCLSMVQ